MSDEEPRREDPSRGWRRDLSARILPTLGWSALGVPLLIFGTLIAAPTVATAADRHGLPGTAIGLGMVACLAILAAVAVRGSFPHLRRRRSMVREARSLGLRRVGRFRLSRSQLSLPALGASGPTRYFESLVAGHRDGQSVFVVDYAIGNDSGYVPMHPRTCALGHLDTQVPALIVEPRSLLGLPEPHAAMTQRSFESGEFDHRYRVWTADARFAEAFIDARMMAWMIDLSGDWSFEVAGSWALCGSGRLAPDRLAELLSNLDGFLAHVPHVVSSLYPAT